MNRVLLFILCFLVSSNSYCTENTIRNLRQQPKDSTEYHFEFEMRYVGSSTTVDINYRYVVEHLIETLRNNPEFSVHIRGHVCCGPSYKISKRRAKNVYKILRRSGISENRISYKGYSDSLPFISPEETEEDEMANRRVDFIIRKH